MPKRIDIPGVGVVEFPDTMDDSAITAAAAKLHQEASPWTERAKGAGSAVLDMAKAIPSYLDPRLPSRMGQTIGTAIVEAGKTIPSLIRQPAATLRGFKEGITEPLIEQVAGPSDENDYRRQGRVAANVGMLAIPAVPKVLRGAKALRGASLLNPEVEAVAQAAARAEKGAGNLRTLTPRTLQATGREVAAGEVVKPSTLAPVKGTSVVDDALGDLLKQRRNLPSTGTPSPDRYAKMAETAAGSRPKPAAGPSLSDALKAALEEQRAPEAPKPIASHEPPAPELPESFKAFSGERAGARTAATRDSVRDELYRSAMQEKMTPGVKVTGLTPKGEAAVRDALEAQGFDKEARAKFYREEEGKRAGYRRRLEDPRGGATADVMVPLAGAGVGGAVGYASGESDDKPMAALRGALLGGGLGLVASHPKKSFDVANNARIEAMLSGMAIPKNIATAIGAAMTGSVESGSMRPITEMARLPMNLKTFAKTVTNPAPSARGVGSVTSVPAGRPSKMNWLRPSKIIGGIDEAANQALRRAGLTEAERDRLLLTSQNAAGAALGLDNPVGRFVLPFQRTPVNTMREGISEVNAAVGGKPGRYAPALPHVKSGMRTAATVASPIIGAAIGEWVSGDPKHRAPIAAVLLSMAGPRTLPATMGAGIPVAAHLGKGAAARTGLGGLSPIPEMSFDPSMMTGWPPALLRLIKRYSEDAK